MKKQEVHIGLNELKSIIKETLKPLMESYYPMSGTCTYKPGENADITDEEYDELVNCMPEEFTISFDEEGSGGDGYNTPDETYVVPNSGDVEKVRSAIANIQNPDLKDKIEMEFNEWLDSADPDMDYDEPDPDRFRDELNEDDIDDYYDSHLNDPERIETDKRWDWEDNYIDPRVSRDMYAKNKEYGSEYMDSTPDYNQNIKGESMTTDDGTYKWPGMGFTYSMDAQKDNDGTPSRWAGQTRMPTMRDSNKSSDDWFPADFDDTQYDDSNYKVDKYGEVNESVRKYIQKLVNEAIVDISNDQQYVIQTRTGGYLMDIKGEPTQYSDDVILLYAFVGRSPVCVMVSSDDYNTLINQGQSIEAQYKILAKGGGSTPLQQCSIAPYNA